jgi:hypothetical protein
MSKTLPTVGLRVRLRREVDRYPHFIAPKGATGTVTDIPHPDLGWGCIAVRLDQHLPGAETWDNEVLWDIDDHVRFSADVEAI